MFLVFAGIFLAQVLCFLCLVKGKGNNVVPYILAGVPHFILMTVLTIFPLFTGDDGAFARAMRVIDVDHGGVLLFSFGIYLLANIFSQMAPNKASVVLKIFNPALLLAVFLSMIDLMFRGI